MDPIEKSGLYYANKFALIMLDALEDVLGKDGLKDGLGRRACG